MRRSTLWMCALLVTTTFGCEQIKPRVAPIGAAFNGMVAAVKDKIELVRVRFFHKKPAPARAVVPVHVPAQPAAPAADTPATPLTPRARAHPAPQEPVPEIAVSGPPRLRDVPFSSPDTGTVFPGMSERDVYSLWGKPVAVRTRGEFTYLFFQNSCEYTCGTLDVVTLQNGKVTDAVVRWPGHGYGGQSSSPTSGPPTGPPPGAGNLRVTPDTTQPNPQTATPPE